MSWFFGILLIAALAFGLSAISGWLGFLGGGLGFALALGLHLLPMWPAILVFALCAATVALVFGRK